MTEKGEKLSAKLEKVRKNIEDTRRLIAYHKKMLKIYIRKEAELTDKLEKEKLNDLFRTVKDKGCDIEAINTAINNGEYRRRMVRRKQRKTKQPHQILLITRRTTDEVKDKKSCQAYSFGRSGSSYRNDYACDRRICRKHRCCYRVYVEQRSKSDYVHIKVRCKRRKGIT